MWILLLFWDLICAAWCSCTDCSCSCGAEPRSASEELHTADTRNGKRAPTRLQSGLCWMHVGSRSNSGMQHLLPAGCRARNCNNHLSVILFFCLYDDDDDGVEPKWSLAVGSDGQLPHLERSLFNRKKWTMGVLLDSDN